ncbi:hypothetical protein J2W22_001248 [Sphingomonas kyeonggiensis]|uniref:hypothetical protein n=1 Tax=Sphingomonas kyeonggiensis TaxID=1268553 RepID=UPI002785C8AB|nr:hypothetical protein [Sphingomonas kyeonggiensis]MDQ0249201.1 hypothetical protein [Sphingomonas kyeonggiensis]
MDWSQIASDFEADGSLRDIYILDTSLEDWASVWAILTAASGSLLFNVDGESCSPPVDVGEAFALRLNHSVAASYTLGRQRLNCHFFTEEEVEFDFDPRQVDGPQEAEHLEQFLSELGRATLKEVRLTLENAPDAIIARYEPSRGQVVWIPAAANVKAMSPSQASSAGL